MLSVRYFISKNEIVRKILKNIQFYLKNIIFSIYNRKNYYSEQLEHVCDIEGVSGYYDKVVINASSDLLLFGRPDGSVFEIFVYDILQGTERKVAETTAWNYQQGAMVEWFGAERIIYNDFVDNSLCAIILNVFNDEKVIRQGYPIQALCGETENYLSINYNRLTSLRPEYGFSKFSVTHQNLTDAADGIWLVGPEHRIHLLVSIEELKLELDIDYVAHCKINHITSNPDGDAFVFLFRCFSKGEKTSYLFHFSIETGSLKLLESGIVSHYCWLSNGSVAIWRREKRDGGVLAICNIDGIKHYAEKIKIADGHPIAYNGDIIMDSYSDLLNYQCLWKITVPGFKKTLLAKIRNKPYKDVALRCDGHPKITNAYLVVDSAEKDNRIVKLFKFREAS